MNLYTLWIWSYPNSIFIHKFFKKYKKYCDDWFDDDENFYHFNPVVKTPEENSKILIKLFKDALQ